eukprot:7124533-Prymnesium_polylepis.2
MTMTMTMTMNMNMNSLTSPPFSIASSGSAVGDPRRPRPRGLKARDECRGAHAGPRTAQGHAVARRDPLTRPVACASAR